MCVHNYRRLRVWRISREFVGQVYEATGSFPVDERFGLTQQLRRAAVSIPSNIAEGAGRDGVADFRRFLHIASGSACEVETQLDISLDLGYLAAGFTASFCPTWAESKQNSRVSNGVSPSELSTKHKVRDTKYEAVSAASCEAFCHQRGLFRSGGGIEHEVVLVASIGPLEPGYGPGIFAEISHRCFRTPNRDSLRSVDPAGGWKGAPHHGQDRIPALVGPAGDDRARLQSEIVQRNRRDIRLIIDDTIGEDRG